MRLALSPLTLAIHRAFGASGPSLDLNFLSGTVDSRITFTRASAATRIGPSGLVETVGTNVARIDYDPVTLQPRGLLVEEQRTNLFLWSRDFANGAWSKLGSSVVANAGIAPDGTSTAFKLREDTANGVHAITQGVASTAGQSYAGRYFVKAAERTSVRVSFFQGAAPNRPSDAVVDLTNGSISGLVGVVTTRSAGNGWWELVPVGTAAGTNIQLQLLLRSGGTDSYTGDGTSGVLIWQADLQPGSFITSPIFTEGAQATRAAEVPVMTGANFSSWYNQAAGTLYVEAQPIGMGAGNQLWLAFIGDGSADSNALGINHQTIITNMRGVVVANGAGATQADLSRPASATAVNKAALSATANSFILSVNGAAPVSDTSGTMPNPNRMNIGSSSNGASVGNLWIRRIAFYPRAMTAAELQALTV